MRLACFVAGVSFGVVLGVTAAKVWETWAIATGR